MDRVLQRTPRNHVPERLQYVFTETSRGPAVSERAENRREACVRLRLGDTVRFKRDDTKQEFRVERFLEGYLVKLVGMNIPVDPTAIYVCKYGRESSC